MLVANLSHRLVEGTDWEYSEFSSYDLGQAVAHMTLQAQSLGLFVRQFRAFDRDALAAEFSVPEHWEITTMAAFGRVSTDLVPDAAIEPAGGQAARDRRPPSDIIWPLADTHRFR